MEHKGTPCGQHADTLSVTKGSFTQTTTVLYKVNANLAANTNRRCNKANLINTRIFTTVTRQALYV